METKYFSTQEQEIINFEINYKSIELLSGLSSREIKEVNKFIFYPNNNPIEQISEIVNSRIKEIMNKYDSKDNKIANYFSLESYKTKIIKKDIKEHKIYKIHKAIESKNLTSIEKIKKISKYSKKAGFNAINILSKEYLARKKLLWCISNDSSNINELSKLYKQYFDNHVGFIEEKPIKKTNQINKPQIPKTEESDLINDKHTLNHHLKNEEKNQNKQDFIDKAKELQKKFWEKLGGLF